MPGADMGGTPVELPPPPPPPPLPRQLSAAEAASARAVACKVGSKTGSKPGRKATGHGSVVGLAGGQVQDATSAGPLQAKHSGVARGESGHALPTSVDALMRAVRYYQQRSTPFRTPL